MLTKEFCPQCRREADSSRVRLVQDSCGHKKCRECLLSEETGCLSCSSSSYPVYTNLRPVLHSPPDNIPDQTADAFLETSSYPDSFPPLPPTSSDVNNVSVQEEPVTLELKSIQNSPDNVHSENLEEEASQQNDVEDDSAVKKRPTYGLKEHIIFTPGDPPKYFCKKCKKSYNNRKAARYHNYCGAPNIEKPHTCNVCGQGFVTKGHFAYHMKSHTGLLPHMCSSCGKGFKQLSKLKRHSKSHEGTPEKPFKCDICEKSFSTKHILKDHTLSHSDSHFVSCPICSKKLSSKSCLRKHKKLHAEPIHKCNQCGKKFSVKWSLDVHLKSHLRERKYKCKLCNRAFKIHSDLTRHAVVHQEDGEWDCQICNLVFRRRDNLVRHFKNIHPESQLNVSLRHGNVKVSEKNMNEISNPQESVSKAPASVSQAVSVIRAVPVIQKAQSVLAHGCTQTLGNTTHSKAAEDLSNNWQTYSGSDQASENVCRVSQNEFTSGKDQNFHRESVVCHSDSRGIVHYGSSALESACDILNTRQRTMESSVSWSDNDSQLNMGSRTSLIGAGDCFSNSNPVQRPRVIVEKKSHVCDN